MIHARAVSIRCEDVGDQLAIRMVNESAFGRADEANLIDSLREEGALILSLLAELEEEVIGHIAFSRMWIDHHGGPLAAVALAPMAVLPDYQRQGIGGLLIHNGLDSLRQRGEKVVIVVGHPNYYPRFGFSREKARALASPFPPEAFMAAELSINALDGVTGRVRYAVAFGM